MDPHKLYFPDQFVMIIVGASKSGKTRGLLEQIKNGKVPFKPDEIYVFSPTAQLDRNFDDPRVRLPHIFEYADLRLVEERSDEKKRTL